MKVTLLSILEGKNSSKMYIFKIKVENVQKVYSIWLQIIFFQIRRCSRIPSMYMLYLVIKIT
jgi:hypothetical protein